MQKIRIMTNSATPHLTEEDYYQEYQKAYEEGCTHLLNIPLDSLGSSTYLAARPAKSSFCAVNRDAGGQFRIEVVDSRAYSMIRGTPGQQAGEPENLIRKRKPKMNMGRTFLGGRRSLSIAGWKYWRWFTQAKVDAGTVFIAAKLIQTSELYIDFIAYPIGAVLKWNL